MLYTFEPNQSATALSPYLCQSSFTLRAHKVSTPQTPAFLSAALSPLTCADDELDDRVQDYFILSEMEAQEAHHKQPEMGWQTTARLQSLASNQFSRPDSERRGTMDSQMSESLLGTSDFPQV